MESGSLLADALRYMQQVHQNEKSLPFDVLDEEDGSGKAVTWRGNESNSIIFSLYCIDETFERCYSPSDGDNTHDIAQEGGRTATNGKATNRLKELQQRLAYIQTVIHGKLKPLYEKRYAHTWFSGGEGISFGLHCIDKNGDQNVDEGVNGYEDNIPHLRALVKYGPHPIDEQYALALILSLSRDLFVEYQIKTAVSCWDVDDGQILLIEGADSIPDWVDDVVGVEGMTNRVYVVNGKIQILDPSVKSKKDQMIISAANHRSSHSLTLKESLFYTMSKMMKNNSDDSVGLNETIRTWLKPFLKVSNESMDLSSKRTLLKDHVQTAAVVLPLRIALLIQQRPDLMSCSILQFCAKAPDKVDKKRKKKSSTQSPPLASPTTKHSHGDIYSIQYENLVFTTITLSKSLYAMLLTAAGQLPPPIKIPKQYKSVELNRMKRQCLLGGEGYAHFRHAIEIGLRLTLGFEWILNDNEIGTTTSSSSQSKKQAVESKQQLNLGSPESRIAHHCRIGQEAGGDDGSKWIQAAWTAGPNSTSNENDISNFVKCPVWFPEISNGGICPLTHCGMSVSSHVKNALRNVDKKDLGAINTSQTFPFPRMEDVDSDSWIDMNSIDELEAKMSEMTTGTSNKYSRAGKKGEVVEMDNNLNEMKKMMSGLDSFVNKESDLEGVVTKSSETKIDVVSSQDDFDLSKISPKIFLTMMHKVLKAKNVEEINDFSEMGDDVSSMENDSELLQYFTRDDLNLVGNDNIETKDTIPNTSMEDIMNAMDEELMGEKDVDRTFKVPTTSSTDENTSKDKTTDSGDVELPFNDPTAIQSNVISNLLESLDAQDGKSGPVSNILKEMGMKPPGEN